jgi:hypothetical protein
MRIYNNERVNYVFFRLQLLVIVSLIHSSDDTVENRCHNIRN